MDRASRGLERQIFRRVGPAALRPGAAGRKRNLLAVGWIGEGEFFRFDGHEVEAKKAGNTAGQMVFSKARWATKEVASSTNSRKKCAVIFGQEQPVPGDVAQKKSVWAALERFDCLAAGRCEHIDAMRGLICLGELFSHFSANETGARPFPMPVLAGSGCRAKF